MYAKFQHSGFNGVGGGGGDRQKDGCQAVLLTNPFALIERDKI